MSVDGATAAPLVPSDPTLPRLREAAAGCTACRLHLTGTQTVFGDGAPDARVVFVGEQPGDEEDREGEPFVGPAGRELDRGLEAAGIDRDQVYVTNVVKHFKWSERRGKRRIHEKRSRSDEERHDARAAFHNDLRVVATLLRDGPAAALMLAPRDALYAQAQERDLPGRSTMTKDALAAALAAALRDGGSVPA